MERRSRFPKVRGVFLDGDLNLRDVYLCVGSALIQACEAAGSPVPRCVGSTQTLV